MKSGVLLLFYLFELYNVIYFCIFTIVLTQNKKDMKELLRFVSVISIAISLFSCASENILVKKNLEQSNIENVQIVRDFEVEITAPIPGIWKRMVEIGYTVKTGDAIGIIENDKGIFMIEVPR